MQDVAAHVEQTARSATEAAAQLRSLSDAELDALLRDLAARLVRHGDALLDANARDVAAGREILSGAVLDRLRLDRPRIDQMAGQIEALAELPGVDPLIDCSDVDGTTVEIRRIPVGTIGANYEARANVTADIASQLIKSRNAGVLRTGGAALLTAAAVVDLAIGPALDAAGVSPDAIGLVRSAEHAAASALVSLPRLVPLVILRGSGDTTARLSREAATHGVRTLAHAEGGGVMYVHPSADRARTLDLIEHSLDRLGVCNRLNLLLIDSEIWDEFSRPAVDRIRALELRCSLPPHAHPLGYEWALDDKRADTVTLSPVAGVAAAAAVANHETSGLAAAIVAEDPAAAQEFIDQYTGTGVFWNRTTRLLDGYRLFRAPETGINIDRVPGPRGPVTYRDLHLRQVVVKPHSMTGEVPS
ncbi:MAG TPA: aldehyde dehydrogenase family protein [Solirubrobacteraceae bacterium]|nr:aldehyde dehydrogenase family protein [Solirubrobacteraceae bacterium]